METLSALQSLGLELPSPAYIVGAIVFGLIGMAAFGYGKKTQQRRIRLALRRTVRAEAIGGDETGMHIAGKQEDRIRHRPRC